MNSSDNRITPLLFLCFLMAIFLVSSCKTGKKIGNRSLKERSPDFLMEQMVRQQVSAEWFEGRAKIGYSDEYLSIGVNATIRMRKDSILWVSVKKLGFEAARALITKDSVYVLDRINNQYGVQGFDWIEKEFGIPASLNTLQMIFLGNPVFFTPLFSS